MEYVPAKTIIYRDKSPGWFGGDYKMNIYRGCCHGCIYCDSRSDCYRVENFDTVRAKADALKIIRDDLRRKVKPGVVITGAMSDPYNPFERELLLTRRALELISAYGFGVAIATKSILVTRDTDILCEIKEHSPVLVKMTVTAAEDDIAKIIEPYVAPSSKRFEAVRELSDKGIYCGILMMPLLPFITDTEKNVLEIIHMAKDSRARFIYPAFGMSMRSGQREYLYKKLDTHYPGLSEKYASLYGDTYQCSSPNAARLWEVFKSECDKAGLLYRMDDIVKSYRTGYEGTQLKFF